VPRLARGQRRFWILLAAIVVSGLALRVWWTDSHPQITTGILVDQTYYHETANFIADGNGFISPQSFGYGLRTPSADKPPLYPIVLAGESLVGGDSVHAHRLLGALLGALTIVPFALLASRLGGERVGITTAALIAIDPQLWVIDSQVLSETLYGVLLGIVLLLAYRAYTQPSVRLALVLGVAVGLAALTRPEGIIVGLLIGAVLLFRHRRAALVPVPVGVLACLLAIAPWTIHNWTVFHRPVFLSQQSAENLAGANCRATYYGHDIGYWRPDCFRPIARERENEAIWAASIKQKGIDYATHHVSRLPLVLVARVARTWGFFRPTTGFGFSGSARWREPIVAWILLALGMAGLLVAVRRRVPLAVLLVPIATVTITALIQFGQLRYRYSADFALLVLAGFAVDALIEGVISAKRAPVRAAGVA
jgi:4-amino-4-deoxy-L-arabinose transferase-like glycosyltransferase